VLSKDTKECFLRRSSQPLKAVASPISVHAGETEGEDVGDVQLAVRLGRRQMTKRRGSDEQQEKWVGRGRAATSAGDRSVGAGGHTGSSRCITGFAWCESYRIGFQESVTNSWVQYVLGVKIYFECLPRPLLKLTTAVLVFNSDI
jgi:hypothetical protein